MEPKEERRDSSYSQAAPQVSFPSFGFAQDKFASRLLSRISELFWLDLYIYELEFGVNPHDVLREIKYLECGNSNTQTKPAAPFLHKPLKGLWHKHFFTARCVPRNISDAFKNGGLMNLIREVFAPHKSPTVKEEMIAEFSYRLVDEPLEDRAQKNRLTWEWIVYAKHNQENYYLCISTHSAGDQMILDRIMKYCSAEFPFLSALFASHNPCP
ncbi:MAG: hypothetical protein WBJ58_01815 [Syntrophales bacterium]